VNHVVTAARRKKADDEVIDVAVTAKLGSLFAVVCTQDHIVTDVNIAGLFCSFFKATSFSYYQFPRTGARV